MSLIDSANILPEVSTLHEVSILMALSYLDNNTGVLFDSFIAENVILAKYIFKSFLFISI